MKKTSLAFKLFGGFVGITISIFLYCAYELSQSHKQFGNFEHASTLVCICVLLGFLFAMILGFILIYLYEKSKE